MPTMKISLVSPIPLMRIGIRCILERVPSMQLAGEAESWPQLLALAPTFQPELVLGDIWSGGNHTKDVGRTAMAIAQLKVEHPQVKVLILTTVAAKETVQAAIDAGVDGYLLMDSLDDAGLLDAIRMVERDNMPIDPRLTRHLIGRTASNGAGEQHLTEREQEVLAFIAQGYTNPEIARQLNLSTGTVKIHVSNILGKLHVASRTGAVVKALQDNLIVLNGA